MKRNKLFIVEFIKKTTEKLLNHNIENAKLESELIISDILCCDRIDLYTISNLYLSESIIIKINSYIEKRIKGEPLQYIIKKAPFYNRQFFVNKHVLIPRFDSELLIDVLKKKKYSIKKVLDVGTGSGNLAITILAENISNDIVATDISNKSIDVAKNNKKILTPLGNLCFIRDDFLSTKLNQKFDLIVSNPPYIPKNKINDLSGIVKNYEPLHALTDYDDGYGFYRKFSKVGKTLLTNDGFMLLEIGVDNDLTILKNIFNDYTIKIFNDLNNIPRVLEIY